VQVTWPPPNRRFGAFDALGLLGWAGLLTARFIPVARLIPFWGCKFRQVTGYPCPGCGLTRSADFLTHLRPLAALKANPLGTVAYAVFAVLAVWTLLHLVFKVPVPDVELSAREWLWARNAALAIVLLNYLFVIAQHRHLWS